MEKSKIVWLYKYPGQGEDVVSTQISQKRTLIPKVHATHESHEDGEELEGGWMSPIEKKRHCTYKYIINGFKIKI